MTVTEQTTKRRFGRKYQSDEFAHYYAHKHQSGWSRRLSNWFELNMIRRSLKRIQRRQPFQTVLDCPSGTGRFLPLLARFNASVVALDTSGAMLQEGHAYHSLFPHPPVAAVGSAFELPLSDKAVDVVLCSRLIHHIAQHDDRVRILKEFARVARIGVVISFFDAASLRAWKRRRKMKRTGRLSGRHAISRAQCADEARCAGLALIGMNALFRFHTEVTAAAFLLP